MGELGLDSPARPTPGPGRLRVSTEGVACGEAEPPNPVAVVGRGAEADVRLDSPAVSRRHAALVGVGGRVFVADLGSRGGTFWGKERRAWGWLGPDGVRIGPFRLELLTGSAPPGVSDHQPPLPVSRSFEPDPRTQAWLEAVGGDDRSRSWRVTRAVVFVGHSVACKVRLPDAGVAGLHCALVRDRDEIWVADLGSRGGTAVNGRTTRRAPLRDGNVLRVGPNRLRFHERPAARDLSPSGTPGDVPTSPAAPPHRGTDAAVLALLAELREGRREAAEQHRQLLLLLLGVLRRLQPGDEPLPATTGFRLDHGGPAGTTPLTLASSGPGADRPVPQSPRGGAETPGVGEDLHVEVARRVAALGHGRENRWLGLLDALKGAGLA